MRIDPNRPVFSNPFSRFISSRGPFLAELLATSRVIGDIDTKPPRFPQSSRVVRNKGTQIRHSRQCPTPRGDTTSCITCRGSVHENNLYIHIRSILELAFAVAVCQNT